MKIFNCVKKKIDQIKFNYYFNIGKGILSFIGIIIILVMFVQMVFIMSDLIKQDTSAAGVFGTLFGAVVGGVFTLFGAVMVFSRQTKAQANVKRKNDIYKPLYDELKAAHVVNLENKYPCKIEFVGVIDQFSDYPIYSVWGKINNDSRSIEVISYISDIFDKFYKIIDMYITNFENAEVAVVKNVLKVLLEDNSKEYNDYERKDISSKIEARKSELLRNILLENRSKFDGSIIINETECCLTYVDVKYNFESADENDKKLGGISYDRCLELQEIIKVRKVYYEWMALEEEILDMLKNLIRTINLKYEN